jgi:hypothetical protein
MFVNLCFTLLLSLKYSEIERWLYGGIGTTTYTLNAKGQMTLWSQEVCTICSVNRYVRVFVHLNLRVNHVQV